MVFNASKAGKTISLYFHKTHNFDEVERKLIAKYKPRYNSSLKGDSPCIEKRRKRSIKGASKCCVSASAFGKKVWGKSEVAEYISSMMKNEKEKGNSELIIVSGEIHKALKLSNRMPTVCSAMRSLIREDDIVLHTTPSGNSSTIKILYKL